jgi:hypothetical protein
MMKFAQSIQQLQSRMEGVENMVKAKGGQDCLGAERMDRGEGHQGLRNKNA